MNYILTILIYFSEFVSMYACMRLFSARTLKPCKVDWIAALLYAVIGTLFPIDSYPFFATLYIIVYFISYICITVKDSLLDRVLLHAFTYSYTLFMQLLIMLFVMLLPISTSFFLLPVFCNLGTLLLVVLTHKLLRISRIYQYARQTPLFVKGIFFNTFLSFLLFMLSFKMDSAFFYNTPEKVIFFILIIISLNACILYYDQRLTLTKRELDSYEHNLPIYKSLIDDIRTSQHEYQNRIQSLRHLSSSCNNYESLRASLLQYTSDYSGTSQSYALLHIDRPLLAATFYSMSLQAESLNISVNYNIRSHNLLSTIPEYEYVDYARILMQNAIESCTQNGSIYIELSTEDAMTRLVIRNTVDRFYSPEELSLFFTKGYSTKTSSKTDGIPHGFGLHYLLSNIKKTSGSIAFDCLQYENKYYIQAELWV